MRKKCATENGRKYSVVFSASALILLFMMAQPALASLGGDAASIQADQARMRATLKSTGTGTFTVHELTTPTGVVVRQYVSSAGRVFGVAWHGPFMPSLPELLGSYFRKFSSASKARRGTATRNHFVLADRHLVLESAGHMLDYSGRAYDPTLLPEGVHGYDVR